LADNSCKVKALLYTLKVYISISEPVGAISRLKPFKLKSERSTYLYSLSITPFINTLTILIVLLANAFTSSGISLLTALKLGTTSINR
jgi:hypothetical protein